MSSLVELALRNKSKSSFEFNSDRMKCLGMSQGWRNELAKKACEKAGVNDSKIFQIIAREIDNFVLNGTKELNSECLPIPKRKIIELKQNLLELLPSTAELEVKSSLQRLVSKIRDYNKYDPEIENLIAALISELQKNPNYFLSYNYDQYFSAKDEKDLLKYLLCDPYYNLYLTSKKIPKFDVNTKKGDHLANNKFHSSIRIDEGSIKDESSNLQTLEKIQKMLGDSYSLPDCSEKSLVRLIFSLKAKKLKIEGNEDVIPLSQFGKELKILENHLRMEGHLSNSQIFVNFNRICHQSNPSETDQILKFLEKILGLIRVLDLSLLSNLLQKADDASDRLQDKHVVVFLGHLGSGKSTTILFLCGCEMEKKETSNGLPHIGPVSVPDELKAITSSPSSVSETSYITPVAIQIQKSDSHKSIVLCDTPGFGDTNGPEVEIANSIGLYLAMKKSKSVKPVLLVSAKSIGDRLTGLKDLSQRLLKMIPNIKEHLDSIAYIFTKFSKEDVTKIYPSFKNFHKHISDEDSDSSYLKLIEDIVNKTKEKILAINPITTDPGDILERLIDGKVIYHPEEVFKAPIGVESLSILKEQVNRHKLCIQTACKNHNYQLVEHKLDELKILFEQLEQSFIGEVYDECVKNINQDIEKKVKHNLDSFNQCFADENELPEEELEKYKQSIDMIEQLTPLRDKYLYQHIIHKESYTKNLKDQVDRLTKKLKDDEFFTDCDEKSLRILKNILRKLMICANFFPTECEKIFEKAKSLLCDKLEEKIKTFYDLIPAAEYTEADKELLKVLTILLGLNSCMKDFYLDKKKQEIREFVLSHLEVELKNVNYIFSKQYLEAHNIDCLKMFITMLKQLKAMKNLQCYLSTNQIDFYHKDFMSRIMDHFEVLHKEIVNWQDSNSLSRIFVASEPIIKTMKLLRTIPEIDALTCTSKYFDTLRVLSEYLKKMQLDLNSAITLKTTLDYSLISKTVICLTKAKWMSEIKLDICSEVIEEIKEEIKEQLKSQKALLIRMKLDTNHYNNLESTDQTIFDLSRLSEKLEKLGIIFPAIAENLSEIKVWFTKSIDENIESIKTLKNSVVDKLENAECIENALNFLLFCGNLKSYANSNIQTLFQDFRAFTEKYCNYQTEEIHRLYEKIITHIDDDLIKDGTKNPNLKSYAQAFQEKLQQISEIKNKWPQTYSYFEKDFLEKLYKRICQHKDELFDSVSTSYRYNQNKSVFNKLKIIKCLSLIDDSPSNKQSYEAFRKWEEAFYNHIDELYKQLKEKLKAYDYSDAARIISALDIPNYEGSKYYISETKFLLNSQIDKFIDEAKTHVKMVGNSLNQEIIEAIQACLKKIKSIKKNFGEYLRISENMEANTMRENELAQIRVSVGKKFENFIKGLEGLTITNNFLEMNKSIDHLRVVVDILEEDFTQDIRKKIETIQTPQSIVKRIYQKYISLSLEEYCNYPPKDLFKRFDEASHIDPIYVEHLNLLKDNILGKIREELMIINSDAEPQKKMLSRKKCETSMTFLPEDIRQYYLFELKEFQSQSTGIVIERK